MSSEGKKGSGYFSHATHRQTAAQPRAKSCLTPFFPAKEPTRTKGLPPFSSALIGLLVLLTGCRKSLTADLGELLDRGSPELGQQLTLQTEIGPIQLEYAPGDAQAAESFRQALERTAPKVARWGKLDAPLRIFLVSHDQLEWHSGRHGYPWLRAWATHDELLMQSPSTFPVRPPKADELEEIVLHELTHSLMYQRSATTTTWRRKQIPLWFREGMATYTAEQGYLYPGLEEIAHHYRSRPEKDPIAFPEPLYQGDREIVYGSAHHAFLYFIKKHGEESVHQLMDHLAENGAFPEGFEALLGQSPAAFLAEFKTLVTTGAFRAPPRFIRHTPQSKIGPTPETGTEPEVAPGPDSAPGPQPRIP